MSDMSCAEVRELAPELALGVVSGSERDDALRHVEGCVSCRLELEAFSRVGDELLRAAPSVEPPSGFEDRVVERMRASRPAPRRWWPVAVAAAAALIVGAASMFAAGAHDRHVAHEYGEVLGTLHGTSLRSGALRDAKNVVVGQVALYEGHPSWVFVAVERGTTDGAATIRLIGKTTTTIDGLRLSKGHGALGSVVSTETGDVDSIEIVDAHRNVLHAVLTHD
jgi:hypothetical protein